MAMKLKTGDAFDKALSDYANKYADSYVTNYDKELAGDVGSGYEPWMRDSIVKSITDYWKENLAKDPKYMDDFKGIEGYGDFFEDDWGPTNEKLLAKATALAKDAPWSDYSPDEIAQALLDSGLIEQDLDDEAVIEAVTEGDQKDVNGDGDKDVAVKDTTGDGKKDTAVVEADTPTEAAKGIETAVKEVTSDQEKKEPEPKDQGEKPSEVVSDEAAKDKKELKKCPECGEENCVCSDHTMKNILGVLADRRY